ncbi:hypothetical protein GCM10022222_40250 [Amycolatopsis ultiminotia]|uniref:Uncharacterized protein n=1 Tax=Amycolatopsis ultiminotia TaxID=543629 RepID=A0ABP6WMI2_9PSEU
MTATDVLDRYGTAALLRFASLILVFTGLHLTRLPFLALAHLVGQVMTAVDGQLGTPPRPRTARPRHGDRWGEAIPHTRRRGRARPGHRPDYSAAHYPGPRNPRVPRPDPAAP